MSLLRVLLVNWPREEALLIKHLNVLGVDVSLLYIDPARFNIDLLGKEDFDVVYISRVGPEIFRDLSMLIKLLDDVPYSVRCFGAFTDNSSFQTFELPL